MKCNRKWTNLAVCLGLFGLLFVPTQQLAAQEESGPGGGESPDAPMLDHAPPPRNEGFHGTPDDILVITYDNNGTFSPNSLNVHNTLVNLTYAVTHLHHPADGVIASTLVSQTFQQVWLFDVNSFLQISNSDAAAIATWYNNNAQGNIVIDARSYGAWFTIATDQFLIENVAHAFSLRCGGLWIGTDHFPTWANQGNAVLNAIGYANVSGEVFPQVVAGDYSTSTATELLTLPNVLTPSNLHAFASPGLAPTGTQSDGTVLVKVLAENSPSGGALTSASLVQDSDNDGIPDDEDACPDSDLSETIVIDGCDSGVGNLLFEDGCTMADLIAECADGAANHGQFVSCVALLTNEWKRADLITGEEEGRIQSCAARSDIPGDLDGDGAVGVADLVMLLGEWGPCRAHPDACPADLDQDGSVGIADLLILLANWG